GCTLFPDPRGMVVIRQSPGGLLVQDELDHLARVDPCSVDGAAEELHALDDRMPVIDQDEAEALVVEVAEPHREVLADLLRRLERHPTAHSMLENGPCRGQDLATGGGFDGSAVATDQQVML